jgi:hypothetical protein
MRWMVKPVALAALACWATVSAAQGRAVFDLEAAAWQATHIVVVEADGEAFRISESWEGNIGPGARLDCYGLVAVDAARYDDLFTRRQGARYVHGHRYPQGAHPVPGRGVAFVPEGTRVVLFLREMGPGDESGIPVAALLPARARTFAAVGDGRPAIAGAAAWFVDGQACAFAPSLNPAFPTPSVLPGLLSEQGIRDAVAGIRAQRASLDAATAISDPLERLDALKPFSESGRPVLAAAANTAVGDCVRAVIRRAEATRDTSEAENAFVALVQSSGFVPSWEAFQAFAEGPETAGPALRLLLRDAAYSPWRRAIVEALRTVDAPNSGTVFAELLTAEQAFWENAAKDLKPGWWDDQTVDQAHRLQLAEHYANASALLAALKDAAAPETASTIRVFQTAWSSVPSSRARGEDAGPDVGALCDAALASIAAGPDAGDAAKAREASEKLRQRREANIRGARKACQNKPAVVRIHPDVAGNASAYRTATGTVKGDAIVLERDVVPEGASVVFLAEEQSEDVVARALRDAIWVWPYQKADLYEFSFSPAEPQPVRIADALGEPIPDADVTLYLGPAGGGSGAPVRCGKRQTDARGILRLPAVKGDGRAEPALDYAGYVVAHDAYGKVVLRHGPSTRTTPLVKRGSPAWTRALRGVVQGPDGQPVIGAVVIVHRARAAPDTVIGGGGRRVMTDNEGRFALHIPAESMDSGVVEEDGLMPAHTVFDYEVTPPEPTGIPPRIGQASNDNEVVLALQAGSRHSLAFRDEFGPVDTALLESITVRSDVSPAFSGTDAATPMVIPHGKYEATLRGTLALTEARITTQFEPLEVTPRSPKTLIFRVPSKPTVCEGKVVDETSGAPVAGAIVVAVNAHDATYPVERLTEDDWATLAACPARPAVSDAALAPLRGVIPFLAATRTDKSGRYRIEVRPGQEFTAVFAVTKGFSAVGQRIEGQEGAPGKVDIPSIKLMPTGQN